MKVLQRAAALTNSTKAKLIVASNATLGVGIGFGLPVSRVQEGLILAALNAWLGLIVHSPKAPASS